jgi:Cdc6-like AAA superfamily ATPase
MSGRNSSSPSSSECDDSDDATYVPERSKTRTTRGRLGQSSALSRIQSRAPDQTECQPVRQPTADTVYTTIKRALATGCSEAVLPGREVHTYELGKAVNDGVLGRGSRVLCVCGVPGTGKTALVWNVIRGLHTQLQQQQVRCVMVNGLELPNPLNFYSAVWKQLTGQNFSPHNALLHLDKLFCRDGDTCAGGGILLVVDEVDTLFTKDQAVLYNIFEWPCRCDSKLMVIALSNTLDLEERVMTRIASRMRSGGKVVCAPYTKDQLRNILDYKLNVLDIWTANIVSNEARDFACARVAMNSGDARKALGLMVNAVDLAESANDPRVLVRHVHEAARSASSSVADCICVTALWPRSFCWLASFKKLMGCVCRSVVWEMPPSARRYTLICAAQQMWETMQCTYR